MAKRNYAGAIILISAILCSMLLSGCGAIRTVGEKVRPTALVKKALPGPDHLDKRVMLFDPVDQAGYGPEATARIGAEVRRLLEGQSRFIIEEPPGGLKWADAGMDLRIAAPVDLLDFCRDEGISTIITLVLSPVESTHVTTGIWPFRSQSISFSIPVRLTALDVVNGTILMTESMVEEDVMKLYDAEMRSDRELLDRFATRIVPRVVQRQVREAVQEMDRWQWRGSIVSKENGKAIINAGSDLGVVEGSRFEVLDRGRTVTARDGRELTVPGATIGKLVVTAPGSRTSVAEPVEGADFEPGMTIRYKP